MKILVAGCSISSGWGFAEEKSSPGLWTNLVASKLNATVTNIAKTASSNYDIFLQTLLEQKNNCYDLVLVQWTGLDRITLASSLDSFIIVNHIAKDTQSSLFQHVTPSDLRTFSQVMLEINNMWKAFVDLGKMTQILGQQTVPHYFINGNLPWTTDFFYNAGHDPFTNLLLTIDTDHKLVRQQIDQVKQQLIPTRWINLEQGWQYSKLDTVSPTDIHAGVASHEFYAKQVIDFLKEKQCQV
jgi:hypothetical protein